MKLKGISTVEQHIEKIVLAVLAVVFLGALATQFLLEPNRVEVSSNSTRPPGEIYEVLESQATNIDGQLKTPDAALPEVKPVDLLDAYESAFSESRPAALASVFGRGLEGAGRSGGLEFTGGGASGGIALLFPPAPAKPVPYAQWSTLDPFAVAADPELLELAERQQQPYDIATVSVEAVFDGTALENELANPASGRPIPRKLWAQTGMAILKVEIERQQRLPTGRWSEAEIIDPRSAVFDPIASMDEESEFGDLVDAVRVATQRSDEVARPAFLPTVSGLTWAPPRDAVKRDMVARNQPEIDRLLDRIARLEGDDGRTTTRPNRPADRDRTGGGRDPGSRRPPPTDTRPDRDDSSNDRTARQIEELENRIRELRGEEEGEGSEADNRNRRSAEPDLLENNEVRVWSHDLTAEPGGEYRYRVRIAVNNPLFDQGALVDSNDEGGMESVGEPLAWSEWSEWSDGVVLGAPEYVFVSSASPASLAGDARATLEVYEMYYGFYRSATISAEIGDAIRRSVQLPQGLVLIDPAAATRADIEAWLEAAQVAAASGEDRSSNSAGSAPAGISNGPERISIDTGWLVADIFSEFAFGSSDTSGTRVAVRRENGSVNLLQAGQRQDIRDMVALSAQIGERTLPGFGDQPEPQAERQPVPGGRDERIRDDDRYEPGGGKRPSGP